MTDSNGTPADLFWLLAGETPTGPFSAEYLHAELAAGRVGWQTPACRVGESVWQPLLRTPGFGPVTPSATVPSDAVPPPCGNTPSASPQAAARPAPKRPFPGWKWGGGGGVAVAVILGLLRLSGCGKPTYQPIPPATKPPPGLTTPSQKTPPPAQPVPPSPGGMDQWASVFDNSSPSGRAPAQAARLAVSCRDGTADLQTMAKGLSKRELTALGLAAVLTGTDVYGAKVTITNTGNVPIRVFPENVQIHFGKESTGVTTAPDSRFLRACVLKPGESTEGLVMYEAAVEIGAAMRLGSGKFSYTDPSVEVVYGR
jgi:hypothetical protein